MTILKTETTTLGALNAATAVVDISDADHLAVQITGTFAGTLTYQGSLDNVTFFALAMRSSAQTTATTLTNTTTTTGIAVQAVGPFKFFKVTMTAYTSGSASVAIVSSRTSK
jgi:hypothetical protein